MTCATVSVPPVPVPVTPVTTSRNKLDPVRQLLRWAKSMRSCQGGPVAAQGARPLAPRHPPGKPPRCPVCPPLRPARSTPVPPLSRLVAPVRAHLAERDARERMVREAAERAADRVWRYFGHDIAGRTIADDLRAALSAKSDEQTPGRLRGVWG